MNLAGATEAIDRIQALIEKCGGPGGTPGPCPRNKPSKPSKPQTNGKPRAGSNAQAVGAALQVLGKKKPPTPAMDPAKVRKAIVEYKAGKISAKAAQSSVGKFLSGVARKVDTALLRAENTVAKLEKSKHRLATRIKARVASVGAMRDRIKSAIGKRMARVSEIGRRLAALASVKSQLNSLKAEFSSGLDDLVSMGVQADKMADTLLKIIEDHK